MAPHTTSRPSRIWILATLLGLAGGFAPADAAPNVTRGPYLQIATPYTITIRWRTDVRADSRVHYGMALSALTGSVSLADSTTEHEVVLTNLVPETRYFYSIGTSTQSLAGGDSTCQFVTAPRYGTVKPTRIWALGDAGTRGSRQRSVRDAYYRFSGGAPTDVWLMLGDNAYPDGTDAEYQEAVFDMYADLLRTTALWPARGNHDRAYPAPDWDYYDIFTLPSQGVGTVASGSEAYYSFDHGNIHFICLDSELSDRSATGAMVTWLREDLAATEQDWIIAYWHHPPYSHGSHNSDELGESGGRLRDMRENVLPVLEAAGVDLVMTGHSHSYERSFLVNGYYGPTASLSPEMIIDGGDGREDGDGAYTKPTPGREDREGAIYVVAGSSGKIDEGPLDHPVMITSLLSLGSLVVDIDGQRLDGRFIDDTGAVRDHFTLIKDDVTSVLLAQFYVSPVAGAVEVVWELARPEAFTSVAVERSDSPNGTWSPVDAPRRAERGAQTALDASVEPGQTYSYRLRVTPRTGATMFFGPLTTTAGQAIAEFALASIAPNPSRGMARIEYTVPRRAAVRLAVVDVQGREIAVLTNGVHRPGRYQVVWSGETLQGPAAAGVYFVRGVAEGRSQVERIVIAR